MTLNLFLGADLTPAYEALGAGGGAAVPAAVAAIFNAGEPPGAVQQTDFAHRAGLLAKEIAAVRPDLIALQEAAAWRTRRLGGDGEVSVEDHLAMLESELADRGLRYRRAVTTTVGDVELPSAAGGSVGLTNRLAILAREDGAGLGAPQSGGYAHTLPIETPLGTVGLARGWAAVDVELPELALRFITTHLEVASSPAGAAAQLAQAEELLAGPAATDGPVVIAADFNARPGSATYDRVLAAGFDDVWTLAHPGGSDGLTCCHAAPLADPASRLWKRIDLILVRGGLSATEAFVVDEFGPGRWPSDHAGVVATLQPRAAVATVE